VPRVWGGKGSSGRKGAQDISGLGQGPDQWPSVIAEPVLILALECVSSEVRPSLQLHVQPELQQIADRILREQRRKRAERQQRLICPSPR